MNLGNVEGIYIAPSHGAPTEFVTQIHVVPGLGIEGDRYFYETVKSESGKYAPVKSKPGIKNVPTKAGQELTLIQIEAIESICKDDGIQLTPDQTRRNIVTRGVSLNNLVGQVFSIGAIQLRGIRLCEPCNYLANRTDPRIVQSMAHRGGLRVEIITDGIIHLNDPITTPD